MNTKSLLELIYKLSLVVLLSGAWTLAVAEEVTAADPTITIEGAMVVQPSIERINGGINPEYFGYRVEGLVLKGANDCLATEAAVEIQQYVENGVLYLVPARILYAELDRVCPSVSQPIFELTHTDIRYSRKEVQKVVIKNVGQDLEDVTFDP